MDGSARQDGCGQRWTVMAREDKSACAHKRQAQAKVDNSSKSMRAWA